MSTSRDETPLAAPTAAKLKSNLWTRDSSLGSFFKPKVVAVIGASEKPGGVGRALLENLGTFSGTLYPVNAMRDEVLGKKAYRNIASVPTQVDLALIATPAVTVPGIIRECVAAGVKAAIVISAGFKESGAVGTDLERQILESTKGTALRVIGPNCLGVMAPHINRNATFQRTWRSPATSLSLRRAAPWAQPSLTGA